MRRLVTRIGCGLFLLAGELAAASPAVFHVSPTGRDEHAGTADAPFATLERARDAVRALKRERGGGLPEDGVTVEVAAGRYRLAAPFLLAEQDSGTPQAPVRYRCAPEARAWLYGGADVPVSALREVRDPALRKRLPQASRAHVRALDLKALGIRYYRRLPDRFNCQFITRYPKPELLQKLGCLPEYGYTNAAWAPLELFCDGQALTPARWPNTGYAFIDQVTDNGEGFAHANTRGGTFEQPSLKEKLKLWAQADEVILHGYFYRDYFCYSTRVAIDPETARVTLGHGLLDGAHKPHQRFYAHHLPEELDLPGEWYLKRETGMLYVWPPEGAGTLMIPVLETAAVQFDKVSHVTVHGFGIEGGRGRGIEIAGGVSNRVTACEIRNIGYEGVAVTGGAGHRVAGCDIHDTASGGILLDGGDRRKLEPAGHAAENNHIHHVSYRGARYAPLVIRGVGNRAARNLLHHIPCVVVNFTGNDHLMEGNEIFLALEGVNELGVFYTGRDWTSRGNVIRNNFIHHVTGVPTWGVRFVHLDDSASGTEICNNICYKMESGVDICGGHDNHIHDNLFVKCKATVSLMSRGIDMFRSDGKGGFLSNSEKGGRNTLANRLKMYRWNQPPYSERYPRLKEIFTKNPIAAPWWNRIERNLAVDCAGHIAPTEKSQAWECVIRDNWEGEDPGFAGNPAELDFRLRPDAEVIRKTGFRQADFDRIGVYRSAERASWPAVAERPPASWLPRWMRERETRKGTPVRVFPVAEIKAGRRVLIDGEVNDEEWSPPGYDGSEPKRHAAAVIANLPDGGKADVPATAYIETDGEALLVAVTVDTGAGQKVSRGHTWGRDDAVEVSLAVAHPPDRMPGQERAVIFRGFADGHLAGSTESGWSAPDVAHSLQGAAYAARIEPGKKWTAEFRIPFAAFGFQKWSEGNRPILAHLAVFRPEKKQWQFWRAAGGASWEIHGGWALWIKPFGPPAYLPGVRAAKAVAHVKLDDGTPERSVQAGENAEIPAWERRGNRVAADFGTVFGDRWRTFSFRFTPKADARATLFLMGSPDAWTYYDDLRAEGVRLVNPGFEERSEKENTTPGWGVQRDKGAAVLRPADGAAEGMFAAKAHSDARVMQSLSLKKDVPVTITFRARAALPLGDE